MSRSFAGSGALTDAQKVQRIRAVVERAGQDVRNRHPWLRHQDAIGAVILALAVAGLAVNAWLYLQGRIAWWICVPSAAILSAFTHEIEHDLIHLRYFRDRSWIRHLMLLIGWAAHPITPNPWRRGHVHLEHHKHAGSAKDFELRGISGGEPWNFRRLLMLGDNALAILLRLHKVPSFKGRVLTLLSVVTAYLPIGLAGWAVWYAFIGFHSLNTVFQALGHPLPWPPTTATTMQQVDFIALVLVVPNILRSFCLHFISSNLHYAGDVQQGNPLQEAQIITAVWLWPIQLLCLNFGATHAIHHFVVGEPFYIREWTAPTAHRVMREMGVRFNDFGTFGRANRYRSDSDRHAWVAPRANLPVERQTAVWRYT